MTSKYEIFSTFVAGMHRDIQKIQRQEMGKFGLKGPHAQCLLAMERNPQGITATRLSQICEKDKAAISRTVTELEERGMVERNPGGAGRYRAMLLLTEKGRAAAGSVKEKVRQAVEQAGSGLEDGQREVFYRVLALIAGNLHAICRDGLEE